MSGVASSVSFVVWAYELALSLVIEVEGGRSSMLTAETARVLGVTFSVLSCHSTEVEGSLPRFDFLTFRGRVLRSCDIPLVRAIAVSPWLGGQGCALPALVYWFSLFLCVKPVVGL